jgi:hypothetical protein
MKVYHGSYTLINEIDQAITEAVVINICNFRDKKMQIR